MAAIDKTYVSTWEEYNEYVNWAKDKVFVCPNGTKIHPIDYVRDYGYEHFDGEIERVLHNTPTSLDYFLIKECPIAFIQDTLKWQYSEEFYESVKNGNSEYDTFSKEGKCGNKIKLIWKGYMAFEKPIKFYNRFLKKHMKGIFEIEVSSPEGRLMWYSSKINNFLWDNELGTISSSCGTFHCHSVKALKRKLMKMNLPKGSIVTAWGYWRGEKWKFKIC